MAGLVIGFGRTITAVHEVADDRGTHDGSQTWNDKCQWVLARNERGLCTVREEGKSQL